MVCSEGYRVRVEMNGGLCILDGLGRGFGCIISSVHYTF